MALGKGMAVMIADKMKGGDKEPMADGTSEDQQGMESGLSDAMAALSSALKSGDNAAAARAFKDASEICGGY